MRLFVAATAFLMLTGCSTISQGTHQTIFVQSSPPGAQCRLLRKGKTIASITATPRKVRVQRTKDTILVTCTLAGYQPGSEILRSGYAETSKDNAYLGGLIGIAVDSATGADNEYPYGINVELVPLAGMIPARPLY